MGINYGADRLRFPSPVRVGSKLRAGAELIEADGTRKTAAVQSEGPRNRRNRGQRQAGVIESIELATTLPSGETKTGTRKRPRFHFGVVPVLESGTLAADGNDLAGHVGRVVAGQEDDHVGDLPGFGAAAIGFARRSVHRASPGASLSPGTRGSPGSETPR